MKLSCTNHWLICGLLIHALAAQGASVTLTPIADATISEKNGNAPIGGDATLQTGTTGSAAGYADSRALLRFNLAGSLPTNALINSATLTLQLTSTAPAVTNLWEDLRRLSRSWSEGVVSWTNRLTPPSPWSVPGGSAPSDFAVVVTQTKLITTNLGPYTFTSNNRMIADVQEWLANPATNFGWIMISELQGVPQSECKFASRESGNNAPKLTILYSLPAIPPMLTILSSSNGNFRFSFDAESNRTYAVEFSDELPSANWSALTNISALPAAANIIVASPFIASNRMHRVRTP